MWSVISCGGVLVVALSAALYLQITLRTSPILDIDPPDPAHMSDLVGFNGTGVYNSSTTPMNLPWNTYNYCNAPHVSASHYEAPEDSELVYLNLMMRHHKVG